MKTQNLFQRILTILAIQLFPGLPAAQGQPAPVTNSVTPNGISAFVVDGQQNPALTLERGVTYVFQVNATFHSFYIKTNLTIGAVDQYTNGVTGNGVAVGNLTFAVPVDAPSLLRYHCGVHLAMGGNLNIIDPPAPPTGEIVFFSVDISHIVMQSAGATNWTAIPEFSSNLMVNTWATVPGYTNSLMDNTNTTGFDRQPVDAVCGPSVFFRIRNQNP